MALRHFFRQVRSSAPRARKWRGALLFLLAASLVSACLPLPETPVPATPAPSETPSPSPTPTETIVWFPPTATFTPFAVVTPLPTPDMRPALGDPVLEDDFNGEKVWPVSRGEMGSAAYGRDEFTLAVNAPKGMVSSLRPEPELNSYYLEIDALPSLCRSQDAYGLMLHAQSNANYYRVWFTCGGQVRMERVKDGKFTVMKDWQSVGLIAPGPLVKTRLGVWALKDELRIFVNDLYQFSVRDPMWTSGRVGLLARAAENTPLTVNFSNLRVRRIDPQMLPTPTPPPTPTLKSVPTRLPTATSRP